MKNIESPSQSQQKPQQIHEIVHSLSRKQQDLLHYFLECNSWMRSMYFSQERLSVLFNVSRKTINEWIAKFVHLGLINKYYRHAKTCEYEISAWVLEEDTQDWLKDFYRSFFKFSLTLMLSIAATSHNVTQLTLKGFNLLNCTSTTVQEGTKMSQVLLPFTEEQRIQLEQYPKMSRDYASKLVTKDLLSGKAIHNQFNYFLSIVKAHAENPPKTGTPKLAAAQSTIPRADIERRDTSQRDRYQEFLDRREQSRRAKIATLGYDYDSLTGFQQNRLLRGESL